MKTTIETKIIIDGRSMTPQLSGIGRYTLELIKSYVNRYGESNVITIVNNPIPYLQYKYVVCPYNRHSIIDTILFSIFLSKQKYQIYHSGDMIGPFWHKKNKYHIITCHDLMYFTAPNFFNMNPIKTILRKLHIKELFKYIINDADLIVSVSRTTHDDLLKIFKRNSVILREGINLINHDNNSFCPFRGLKNNTFFLYVGLGSPHKNINFLINSFLSSKTNKKLVICGKGHTPIKSERIIYTGYIEDKDLNYLYSNCAAFIFPSKYEGFGLPILEALSYHCKVFSSNAGSLSEFSPEIINFFNPNNENELISLIENCDKITINIPKIDQYLKYFNWNEIWNEFHSKYIKK